MSRFADIPRPIEGVTFGSDDTRLAWERRSRLALETQRVRWAVAPGHRLPSRRGTLGAGSSVTLHDLEGFTQGIRGESGYEILAPREALRRAIDCGIILEASQFPEPAHTPPAPPAKHRLTRRAAGMPVDDDDPEPPLAA